MDGCDSISIILKAQVFIAFWLGVKTALRWDIEKKVRLDPLADNIEGEEDYDQRVKFHYLRFLLGNSLNIIISYLIAAFIKGDWILF